MFLFLKLLKHFDFILLGKSHVLGDRTPNNGLAVPLDLKPPRR